jgi:hypothetical protein
MLTHGKTRWLTLLPAIERMLRLWPALKSYFSAVDDCPIMLERFFEAEESEIVACFLQSVLSVFDTPMKKLQRTNALLPEFFEIIGSFKKQILERKEKNFFGAMTASMLNKLDDQYRAASLKKSFKVRHYLPSSKNR